MADAQYYGHLRRGPSVATTVKSDAGVYDEHGMTAEVGGPAVSVTAGVAWSYDTRGEDFIKIVIEEVSSGRTFVLFEGNESAVKALIEGR